MIVVSPPLLLDTIMSNFLSTVRHPSIRLPSILILGLFLSLQWGCNSYPEPTKTYEYVEQYGRMSDAMDPVISLIYSPADVNFSRYKGCIVGNIAVGEEWVDHPAVAQRYANYFRQLLVSELRETNQFKKVTKNSDETVPHPALRIEGMCTVFETGSGTQRFFSYFLPFLQKGGATDFQLEGRIYNIDTGRIAMEFVDRRRHLGNTPWLPNPSTFSDQFVMKHTLLETAHSLARVLASAQKDATEEETLETTQLEERQ